MAELTTPIDLFYLCNFKIIQKSSTSQFADYILGIILIKGLVAGDNQYK